jgi:transposase
MFGAVDDGSGQVLWQFQPRKGDDAFAAFLEHIAQSWPDEHLMLVMDNVSYHRSPIVRVWWAEQGGRVTPLWLPVYAPNLNLMERVWRVLKHTLACHRFSNDVVGLETTAGGILDRLEARFHTDRSPGIRLVNNVCEVAESRAQHPVIHGA